MKFVFGYRTELFMIFLVPIRAIQWYRFLRYSGTGSSAMMVPIRALRWYRLTDTIKGRVEFNGCEKMLTVYESNSLLCNISPWEYKWTFKGRSML